MKYKLWWVALVVLAGVCAADVVCFSLTGWTPFYYGKEGAAVELRLVIAIVFFMAAAVTADLRWHLADRSK